jgi:hypothetical protein
MPSAFIPRFQPFNFLHYNFSVGEGVKWARVPRLVDTANIAPIKRWGGTRGE